MSQLLMKAWHDPIAYKWNMRHQMGIYLQYTCAHKHANAQTHICTHALLDMARWCNPSVFCVFHFFFFSPPVLGLCCCPIRFGPTLQRWCDMNDRRVGGCLRQACRSRHTVRCAGCKCSTKSKPLWLLFVEPLTDHHCAGKRRVEPEPGPLGNMRGTVQQ